MTGFDLRPRLTACLPPAGGSPGFALPLFTDPIWPNGWAVQEVDELTRRVRSFLKVDGSLQNIVPITDGPKSGVGENLIYVFVEANGQQHAGTLDVLKNALRGLAINYRLYPAVLVQIFELIGSIEEKRAARSQMTRAIPTKSGAVDTVFQQSVLRAALWDRLLTYAASEESARRILKARSSIDAKVESSGKITVDLSAISPIDYTGTDEQRLATELQEEFVGLGREYFLGEGSSNERPKAGVGELIEETISKIRRAPRQEDRIALILEGLATEKALAYGVIERYESDRAKFARRALGEIRHLIEGNANLSGVSIVALLVDVLYKEAFPMNRGIFLYALARRLRRFPEIAKAIRRQAMRSNSVFVLEYRAAIAELLDGPK